MRTIILLMLALYACVNIYNGHVCKFNNCPYTGVRTEAEYLRVLKQSCPDDYFCEVTDSLHLVNPEWTTDQLETEAIKICQ